MVMTMGQVGMGFLLSTMAGLATMLGMLPILFKIKNEDKVIASSLAFAAGVMLCVSITDLIPESFLMLRNYYRGLWLPFLVFLSLILGVILAFFIEKGMHLKKDVSSLYQVGVISMLAIILHNLPEGIATFLSTTKSTSLGLSLAIAIALHNIPEGISISIPIYYSTRKKTKAFWYTFVSALSEPMGALLTYLFLTSFVNSMILGTLFAFIAGVMLFISFRELIPTSREYAYFHLTRIWFVIGVLFMLIKFMFF